MHFGKYLRNIHSYATISMFLFAFTISTQGQLKILPLGNSITKGTMCLNGSVSSCDRLPDAEAIGYRYQLYNLLVNAGFTIDFVGNNKYGYSVMSDSDNGGFPGIRDNFLADIMETGTSGYTGIVTTGPYMNSYPADIVLLHIGTNDVSSLDYSVSDVARILDAIDDYESSSGQPVLVFLAEIISRQDKPCGTDAGTVTYNNNLRSMALNRISSGDHIVLVDMECDAGLDYSNDLIDQLHPNQTGYDKMADKWFEVINNYNRAPNVTQIPNQNADRGTTFNTIQLDSYVSDAEDSDSEISWAFYPSNPQHFSITISSSRVATITPLDPNWSGSETVEFVATDNGKVIQALKRSDNCLTTFTVNWIPEITGQLPVSTTIGTPLLIEEEDLLIVDAENAPQGLELQINPGSNYTVSGQTINPAQGFIGQLTVPVRIIDGSNQSNLYNLIVNVTNINHPPVITSIPVLSAKVGMEYIYDLEAEDEDVGDVLIFSALSKPGWMQINQNTGLVSGTPGVENIGNVNIALRVYDGEYYDTQSYTLKVHNDNLPPEVITDPDDSARVAVTYSYGIQAIDPEGDPVSYYAKTLPGWLIFYPETQVMIGMPGPSDTGDHLVVLGITDQKDTIYQVFIIHVNGLSDIGEKAVFESPLVYPNPASHHLFIDFETVATATGRFKLEIYDLTGRKVLEQILVDRLTEIPLQPLEIYNGLYMYRLIEDNQKKVMHSGKIMIRMSGE